MYISTVIKLFMAIAFLISSINLFVVFSGDFSLWSFSLTIIMLVTVLGSFGFILYRLKPLEKLKIAAEEIAGGNLTVNFDDRGNDEIGELAQSFCNMQNSIYDMINETHKRSQEIVQGKLQSNKNKLSIKGDFQKIIEDIDAVADGVFQYLD
ncbi:MAG: HAMP domain-containing protein, partial [Defluviitaleaceae bacterium]|nr:HAMP domain-containing protein [Defluviitaleaceae bacterium]